MPDPAPPEQQQQPPQSNGRTYTEDDLQRIVRQRLDAQRAQFGDIDSLRTEHAQLTQQVAALEPLTTERDTLRTRVQELERSNAAMTLRSAVQAEAVRSGARHPDDIYNLLPPDAVRIEDGKPVGVAEAVRALAEARPGYFGVGASDAGARPQSGPAQQPNMNDLLRAAVGRR